MRRSIAVVSAAVTAFSLVILASVVYAYQVMAAPRPVAAQAASQASVAAQVADSQVAAPAAPAAIANVAPLDAASLAAKYLNRTDAYSVQMSDFNGTPAYKVTFASGDIVYVGMTGQILGKVPAPAVAVTYASKAGRGEAAGGQSSGGHGESHGGHDDGGEHDSGGGGD